ncbi:aminotransferase class V-fold PLP-dependent enzyme [Bryobacter aggregatus]|uniref:aminotransferase class V-fold PLP-dependent enzyme n=1 Tax=Bryobacter aggregatus TaxID=360054 RepID=UPI0012BB0FC5|nr:aminotransferase class V-fold PLP-dependent enzyme [Bryobacter aggregatus]
MFNSLRKVARRYFGQELLGRVGAMSLPTLFGASSVAMAQSNSGLRLGTDIYRSIGITPLINCRGTLTIVGGSLMLQEVREAYDAASRQYVHIDEMMDSIGKRLATLTGAEYGMVSSGCSAAIAHATAACVAGSNPDLHVRIPNLEGFAKDEVIIPKRSRNVYDAAVRSIGVRIIEVSTPEELEAAIGPRTAMIYIYAGPQAEAEPLPFPTVTRIANQKKVPVMVDAAAELLTVPNVHLERGATLVGYSGGKVLRGPQACGILIGRKDLIQAAWMHSAPHHGYGRSMKIGKEEAMAMLMAVEMWFKRDHKAEMRQYLSWLDDLSARVKKVDGVNTTIREASGLSNHTPNLYIRWDANKLGITGEELTKILYTTEPRVALAGGGGNRNAPSGETGIQIAAFMMQPGDSKIVGDRVAQILGEKRPTRSVPALAPPVTNLSGKWEVKIQFTCGSTTHYLHLKQDQNRIEGTHQGDFVSRDLIGTIDGKQVRFASSYNESHGDNLSFRFTGNADGDSMSGDLDMGEYMNAKWTATRYAFRG